MALCRTGTLVLKAIKPVLASSFFIIPSPVNVQVRHAARKGYRDKIKRHKKLVQTSSGKFDNDFSSKLKKKYSKLEKTINLKKPEPPDDDVIIMSDFNYKKFTLSEAVKFHREYHHPTVFNNPEAPVTVRIEINMKDKKKLIKPFSGVVDIPHHFSISHKKEVLVLCSSEDKEMALSCGAAIAGNVELIEKIKEGVIQPSLYEYILAHVSILPLLPPIRNILKNQYPKVKNGTLTKDLKSAIVRFLHGIKYSCEQFGSAEDFSFISCNIGTINMELDHLEENLKVLIKDIEKNKVSQEGDFITWIWCSSRPSNEEFSLDLSQYVESQNKKGVEEDDDEVEMSNEKLETKAAKALAHDYKEEELLKSTI